MLIQKSDAKSSGKKSEPNPEILANIEKAMKMEGEGTEFKFEERDVMLYNLGVGAKKKDLRYVL